MPHPNQPVAVRHPEVPNFTVVLDPSIDYDSDDILVRAYPQFFVPVENGNDIVESVSIEAASAAPGEKRARRSK